MVLPSFVPVATATLYAPDSLISVKSQELVATVLCNSPFKYTQYTLASLDFSKFKVLSLIPVILIGESFLTSISEENSESAKPERLLLSFPEMVQMPGSKSLCRASREVMSLVYSLPFITIMHSFTNLLLQLSLMTPLSMLKVGVARCASLLSSLILTFV